MKTTITTMNYYPNRYWFFYFKKYTYIKGFQLRLFGVHINIRENDSFNKLVHIGNIQRELRKNKIV